MTHVGAVRLPERHRSFRYPCTPLADRIAALFWHLLFGFVGRVLPFRACRMLALPLGSLAWAFGLRRRVTLRNLALALPGMSASRHRRIGRGATVNLFTVYLEVLTLRHLSDSALRRAITVENIDLLGSLGPDGAILLSGHFGNWELLAFGAAALSGVPFSIIVKEQRDHGELERTRTARGNSVIPTSRGAREASVLLRRGGLIAMLADQSAPSDEVQVPMFGIPTYTYSAPARLALRFRPRVITGFAHRLADGTYRVRLGTIEHDDLPDTPEGAREFAARYVAQLEAAIREHPEQWVWQHRKWKNTPGITY